MSSLLPYINKLGQGLSLSQTESFECLTDIFKGNTPSADIEQLLIAMSDKGEAAQEVVGFAKAMRAHMLDIPISVDAIDVCGTGGSLKDRFNVSTASAFVLASMGVTVAKHGNRGSRKANGSFDFLEALGVPFGQDVDTLKDLIETHRLGFIFARNHHPAMRHVSEARKSVGRRTIFNVLGPLCNPAGASYQVIGCSSVAIAQLVSGALQKLNGKRAIVVAAESGIDELSIQTLNHCYDVTSDGVRSFTWDPKDTVLFSSDEPYAGETAEDNAAFFLKLLSGEVDDAATLNTIAANAGVALYCVGQFETIEAGALSALEALKSGKVQRYFTSFPRD